MWQQLLPDKLNSTKPTQKYKTINCCLQHGLTGAAIIAVNIQHTSNPPSYSAAPCSEILQQHSCAARPSPLARMYTIQHQQPLREVITIPLTCPSAMTNHESAYRGKSPARRRVQQDSRHRAAALLVTHVHMLNVNSCCLPYWSCPHHVCC